MFKKGYYLWREGGTGIIYLDKEYEVDMVYPTFVFSCINIFNDSIAPDWDRILTLSDLEKIPVEKRYTWGVDQKKLLKRAVIWLLTQGQKCDM